MKKIKSFIQSMIFLGIGLFGIVVIYFLFINRDKDSYLYVNVDSNNNVTNPVDYKSMIDKARKDYGNNDIVGILKILNTDYVVPILQSSDNDYYLVHDAYGRENYMGAIFLDYREDIDSNKKLLIFGHNSDKIEMPFDILENYYDEDYYKEHKYIEIITSKAKKKYEIFSVHVEVSDFTYMNLNYNSDEEYLNHLQTLKDRSMYYIDTDIDKDTEVLIMQTCSEHPAYRNYEDKYLLIVSKRI